MIFIYLSGYFLYQVVSALFELYNWKGPKNINVQKKEKEVNSSDAEIVSESVHSFLLVLCTSKRFGVIFSDNAFRIGDVKNNLLFTVIQVFFIFKENAILKSCQV